MACTFLTVASKEVRIKGNKRVLQKSQWDEVIFGVSHPQFQFVKGRIENFSFWDRLKLTMKV